MFYIAANRLPFTVVKEDNGYSFSESPGGVASGLRTWAERMLNKGVLDKGMRWVGWPGVIAKSPEEHQQIADKLKAMDVVQPSLFVGQGN